MKHIYKIGLLAALMLLSCSKRAAKPIVSTSDAPANLIANTLDSTRVRLTWRDKSNDESGFVVQRYREDSTATWKEITRTPANDTAYIDSTRMPGNSYRYRVAAFDNANHNTLWCSESAAIVWEKTYGGRSASFSSVIPETNGEYLAAGRSLSGPGYGTGWLVKVDARGKRVWAKTFGGDKDSFFGVIHTTGGGYLAVGARHDRSTLNSMLNGCWLVEVDDDWIDRLIDGLGIRLGMDGTMDGTENWTKTFGGSWFSSVIPATDGGYLAAGSTLSSSPDVGGGLLVKVDTDGNQVWAKRYGGGWFSSVIPATDGGYIAVGRTHLSGTVMWTVG